MTPPAPSFTVPGRVLRAGAERVASGWRGLSLAAAIAALALSPSSYRGANGTAMARHLYLDTAPVLAWFAVLSALVSLVLIRIVVATAISYGMPQYALEMLVRVLVLELIPLTAALFVALRCSIPHGAEIAVLRRTGRLDALRAAGIDPVQRELTPRVVAGVFAVLMLATVSGVLAGALSYLGVYGFTVAGLPAYTRTVGHVFDPGVSLVFCAKTVALAIAVAVIPVASAGFRDGLAADSSLHARSRTSAELQGLVRLFVVVLLVESLGLVGNYY